MDGTNRRFILTGLVMALIVAGFVGWMWGSQMKQGIEANAELQSAKAEYYELAFRLGTGDGGSVARLEVLASTVADKEAAYNEYAVWHGLYRITNFFGKLFLNLLTLLVIPLIVATIIMGMVSLGDIRRVGLTGLRTVIYYMGTTTVAVLIGLFLVQMIAPGTGVEGSTAIAETVHGKEDMGVLDTVLKVFVDEDDKARGAFPGNITGAMANMNVLGVIVFSLLFGAALSSVGERGRTVVSFFDGMNETVLKLIGWIMYLLPLGVFGLLVGRLAETGGGAALWTEISRVGYYSLTVVCGLTIHGFVVLPLLLWLFTGRNPLAYAAGMLQALLTALSTASSSATLPTTLECSVINNRVSQRSASFVLPLGATINMDGTALYEAVAVVFIAQVYGIPMDMTILMVVFLTATLAAIGAAGIPEAGLVTMVIVLNATGLPLEGIAILLSVDWILDRFRTTVNVWGDAVGAAVIDSYEGNKVAQEG